jgi:hypothetical protein
VRIETAARARQFDDARAETVAGTRLCLDCRHPGSAAPTLDGAERLSHSELLGLARRLHDRVCALQRERGSVASLASR